MARLAASQGGEVVPLHWRFGGFFGVLAGLFVPSSGDGLLTFVPRGDERIEIQLLITAPRREGEYFLYGAEIDTTSGATLEVWSSYSFRGRASHREQSVEDEDVIDLASAIYRLRYRPPAEATRMSLWSGGKLYAASIQPLSDATRKIAGDRIPVRGYAVRGVESKAVNSFRDRYELYFARNQRATPVEIMGRRGPIRLRIQLEDSTLVEAERAPELAATHPAARAEQE